MRQCRRCHKMLPDTAQFFPTAYGVRLGLICRVCKIRQVNEPLTDLVHESGVLWRQFREDQIAAHRQRIEQEEMATN